MDAGNLLVLTELMLIAVMVAVAVKYIRLPYTVALVLVGLVVGFTDVFETVHLSREVILFVFLPPLLFEGTLNMDLKTLRDKGLIVGVLALAGTLVSTALLGLCLNWIFKFPMPVALLLGAIITPTDPVSVLATFKQHGVTKGLSTIVEGESVFNDGIGVVIYLLLLNFIGGEGASFGGAIQVFLWEVCVGAALGVIIGYFTHIVLGKIDDHMIEVLISVILAYGVYLLAERLHCSGVVAVVCAGLIIGNYGRILSMSPKTRVSLSHFWEVIAFAVNSILFLLIGLDIDSGAMLKESGPILAIFLLMLATRSITVYSLVNLVGFFRKKEKIPASWQHTANWAGLRGSIPIALALGLPPSFGYRTELVTIVFGVVLLSLTIQGLTIKPLLKKLKLIGGDESMKKFEHALAQRIAAKAAIRELNAMQESGQLSDYLHDQLLEGLRAKDQEHSYSLALLKQEHEHLRRKMSKLVAHRLGYAQHTELQQAFIKGMIGDEIFEKMIEEIDADIDQGVLGVLDELPEHLMPAEDAFTKLPGKPEPDKE